MKLHHFDYKESRGEKQLKNREKKRKFHVDLRKPERWAILIALLFLALTAGWHIGLGRRTPDFSVTTSRDRAASPAFAETAAAERAEAPIDINAAGAEELRDLDGIGEVLAARIVAYRAEHGPFEKIEDIQNVSGVGAAIFEANRNRITVNGAKEEAP